MSWGEWLVMVIAHYKVEIAKLEAQAPNGSIRVLDSVDDANDEWDRFALTGR